MIWSTSKSLSLGVAGFALIVAGGLTPSSAWAQTPPPPPPPGAPAAPPDAAPATPPAQPLTAPSMAGPLALNPNPINFDAAGAGHVYVTGIASGLALFQSNPIPSDTSNNFDLSNATGIVQKIDGVVQYYMQVGGYSLPALGFNYNITQRMLRAENNYFGLVPEGYLKIAPTDNFSVEGGALPSLIGDEYTFTFQNMNIERGLLWGLEPAISKGVQANLTTGPVVWAASLNDGFYSNEFNWISGSATWTINPTNTLVVAGGGNFATDHNTSIAAPFALNNSDIVNLIYTYNNAPWTISPYFQYTDNQGSTKFTGTSKGASSWGGAILANYSINDNWNLAGRFEYVSSSGSTNLLYGPGSSAYSFTLTPTYQNGIFFARIEGSYVGTSSTTAGSVFGSSGTNGSQARVVFETGVVF